jgi:hypothetical protein
MDDIVKQAMAKWPNVPNCYGWLGLDARGNWRMRDEQAQHNNLPGDKLMHTALIAFINRNYDMDARGCWYFQNGPQRVFVNLEATPFIARTDPVEGLLLHTGDVVKRIRHAWLTEHGQMLIDADGRIAQVDDRDVAQLMEALEFDGKSASDEKLMAWMEGGKSPLTLRYLNTVVAVDRIAAADVAQRFAFVRTPSLPLA